MVPSALFSSSPHTPSVAKIYFCWRPPHRRLRYVNIPLFDFPIDFPFPIQSTQQHLRRRQNQYRRSPDERAQIPNELATWKILIRQRGRQEIREVWLGGLERGEGAVINKERSVRMFSRGENVGGVGGAFGPSKSSLCFRRTLKRRVSGRSYQGINEEIIWVSIGMGITIAVLITIALCYIMREKCVERREYYITAWVTPLWIDPFSLPSRSANLLGFNVRCISKV